jgi:3-deoxy-7-phosphoheptulonate synthase
MLTCYRAASDAMEYLAGPADRPALPWEPAVWTSHEALVLDYELPQVLRDAEGRALLTSTHWPWIGERTRDLDGAHVALFAELMNPVACKVGPSMRPAELLELCERLDPDREAGRLTLIARMGSGVVAERLPALVAAVRSAGHPVIWLCDPMHANTVSAPNGRKTRLVTALLAEVRQFQAAVAAAGGVAGGLHLETTPAPVDECVFDDSELGRVGEAGYRTLCDPRLNPEQALTVAAAWGR